MDQEIMDMFSQAIEGQIKKAFERFDYFCKVCKQNCEESYCRINNSMINEAWDIKEGGDEETGRHVMKFDFGEGVTHISETRPLWSLFSDPPALSIRGKFFTFFQIEDSKLGIAILREMAKKNEKFNSFLIKMCLYAKNSSTYMYADEEKMYDDIFIFN